MDFKEYPKMITNAKNQRVEVKNKDEEDKEMTEDGATITGNPAPPIDPNVAGQQQFAAAKTAEAVKDEEAKKAAEKIVDNKDNQQKQDNPDSWGKQ